MNQDELINKAFEAGREYSSNAGHFLEKQLGRDNMNVGTIGAFGAITTIGLIGTSYKIVRDLGGKAAANKWLEGALMGLSEAMKNLDFECSISIVIKSKGEGL